MTRPAGARGETAAACPQCGGPRQRRPDGRARCQPCETTAARTRRRAPLLTIVREFLAEGVPMTQGAGYGLSCAFCGASLEVLRTAPTTGHVDGCRWVRLRQQVAGEN